MAQQESAPPESRLKPFQPLPHVTSFHPRPEAFQQIKKYLKERVHGTSHYLLLAGNTGMQLACQIGELLGRDVPGNPAPFANGENRAVVKPELAATRDVYIVQSVGQSPDEALRELKNQELGAKSAGANRIINIVTQLPYARQDRVEQPGAPDAARNVIQEILDAGSHNYRKRRHQSKLQADAMILAVEIHSEAPFEIVERDSHLEWANLDSSYVLAPRIQQIIKQNNLDVVFAFPDKSAAKRYGGYVDMFTPGTQPAIIKKERSLEKNNSVTISASQENLTQTVSGKDIILVDDIIDTAGSILQAAKHLKSQGARSVRVVATHGIFSNDALTKMADPAIDGVTITDSINPTFAVLTHPNMDVVPLAPLIAETIRRMEAREPLTGLIKGSSKNFENSYRRGVLPRKVDRQRRIEARKLRRQSL